MIAPYKKPTVIKAFNAVTGLVRGKNPLDANRLMKSARRRAGKSDFGDDLALEAFQRLVDAINKEARLHPFGKFMIGQKLLTQLENRLWAEHWINTYPEILERETLPVLLVTGLQRTGTTKMQRLLSDQSGARALHSWEALYPAPLKDPSETASRIAMTQRNERAVKFISPVFHNIHPIHTHRPEEDVLLMDLQFMSSSSEAILNVPSFAEWLHKQDQATAYSYENRLLKLLQWQSSGSFWVLKSPHHLEYLHVMQQQLPVKGIVWMHRSLDACVSSFMSMLYYSRAMFSDHVNERDIVAQWIPKIGNMLEGGLNFQRANPGKMMDVEFSTLMSDSKGVVDSIRTNFSDIDMAQVSIPEEKYSSKHKYKTTDWAIPSDMWKKAFNSYEQHRKQKG